MTYYEVVITKGYSQQNTSALRYRPFFFFAPLVIFPKSRPRVIVRGPLVMDTIVTICQSQILINRIHESSTVK